MSRNNILLITTLLSLGVILSTIKIVQARRGAGQVMPIVVEEPLPHPFLTAVGNGAAAYGRDSGAAIRVVVGQESTQANVNTNIESMFTIGHHCFAIYPVDPAGSKGLFARLAKAGCHVVAYGAQPEAGTQTPFAVATDTKAAATLAAQTLVDLLGQQGNVLDVLESATDANTPIRQAAVESVIAKYPGVHIIQTVGDVTTEQTARVKIDSALAARGDEIDGIICTGYTTTVAAATLLVEHNAKPGAKRIRFIGLDDDDRVLAAIRSGSIDATIAQNPFGLGYISCALLDLLDHGWTPKSDYQFIDSSSIVVTKDNLDAYHSAIEEKTRQIVAVLKSKYLDPPKNP